MPLVALLSNPRATGNLSYLPRVREFVARHPNVFHYEVEHIGEIPQALEAIARVKPVVLVINGGDGTVQAALTELHHGRHFGTALPPLAVLPNGKTNLIALDLGATGDPIKALQRIIDIAEADMRPHVVARQLIALSGDERNARPVLGMFLGGAGLAQSILFCRHKIYPLGMPNWVSHLIALMAVTLSVLIGGGYRWLPIRPTPMRVSVRREGQVEGRFFLLLVTTLERLLLNVRSTNELVGSLKLMAIEQNRGAIMRAIISALRGRLGTDSFSGFYLKRGDEIRIEGDRSSVILDGELYEAKAGGAIVLTTTAPISFLSLAA